MNLKGLNNLSFGLKVQQNQYNRTKEQENFTKKCLYSDDVERVDRLASGYTDGGIFIKENEDGSTSLSLICHNFFGDPVLSHESEFDLTKTDKRDIKAQLCDFLKNAEECVKCVMAHPTLGNKRLTALLNIQREANEIEKTYYDARMI